MNNEIQTVNTSDILFNNSKMDSIYKIAELMASGKATIPVHLQGNPADCMAIVLQAVQWNLSPFPVAQKSYVIKGKLSYEAQLVNSVIQSMAPTKDRINYEWFGDWDKILGRVDKKKVKDFKTGKDKLIEVKGWTDAEEQGLGIKVFATMKGENKPRELTILMTQVRIRNSTLWLHDPKQQIAYLGVKRWSGLHCPDVVLGVYTPDELQDSYQEEKDITPVIHQEEKKHVELPALGDEKFNKTYASFFKAVESGKKTTQDIINSVSSTFKLRQEQIEAIQDIDNIIVEKKKEKESKEVEDTKKFDPNSPEDNEIPFNDD